MRSSASSDGGDGRDHCGDGGTRARRVERLFTPLAEKVSMMIEMMIEMMTERMLKLARARLMARDGHRGQEEREHNAFHTSC